MFTLGATSQSLGSTEPLEPWPFLPCSELIYEQFLYQIFLFQQQRFSQICRAAADSCCSISLPASSFMNVTPHYSSKVLLPCFTSYSPLLLMIRLSVNLSHFCCMFGCVLMSSQDLSHTKTDMYKVHEVVRCIQKMRK